MLLVFALVVLGCASASLPSREGSVSPRVMYAYFSKELPSPRMSTSTVPGTTGSGREGFRVLEESAWLPERVVGFDVRDEQAIFVFALMALREPTQQEESDIRMKFTDPAGRVGEAKQTVKVDPRYGGFWRAERLVMSTFRRTPGWWTLDLSADGEHLGTYRFLIGDADALARATAAERTKRE